MTVQSPIARQRFARRLREFRVARGFKTARSLARALEIDENRYTRYERAEVEPDMELIQQICETLKLSPNDLLGTASPSARHLMQPASTSAPAGFAEPASALPDVSATRDHLLRDKTAWSLACAVAELQSRVSDPAPENPSRMATLRHAARLFADLERRPFAAVSEILLHPAVSHAPAQEAHRIENLIEAFTHATDR